MVNKIKGLSVLIPGPVLLNISELQVRYFHNLKIETESDHGSKRVYII